MNEKETTGTCLMICNKREECPAFNDWPPEPTVIGFDAAWLGMNSSRTG